jgi:RNA polymerase sigma-70 factor (sigma-E family)
MDDDQDGFTVFVIDHEQRLLGTAYLLTGDFGHAQDLLQATRVKTYRHWSRVRGADHPLAYVRQIMVNTQLSWRRRLTLTEVVTDAIPDRSQDDLQATQAIKDEVRRALLRLAPRTRAVIVLRYYEDLTEAETARLLGCSVSTVNTHTARGIAALRHHLRTDDQNWTAPRGG